MAAPRSGALLGFTLCFAACCGLPMLPRRCVVTPLAALLLFLFSLTVALFVPALTFLVRLTAWLDGDRLISAEAKRDSERGEDSGGEDG